MRTLSLTWQPRPPDSSMSAGETDWVRPTCTGQGNLLSSKFSDLNACSSRPKLSFPEIPRIVFDQISGRHGPAELTRKINHDTNKPARAVKMLCLSVGTGVSLGRSPRKLSFRGKHGVGRQGVRRSSTHEPRSFRKSC